MPVYGLSDPRFDDEVFADGVEAAGAWSPISPALGLDGIGAYHQVASEKLHSPIGAQNRGVVVAALQTITAVQAQEFQVLREHRIPERLARPGAVIGGSGNIGHAQAERRPAWTRLRGPFHLQDRWTRVAGRKIDRKST